MLGIEAKRDHLPTVAEFGLREAPLGGSKTGRIDNEFFACFDVAK
jgi:hypothetical protein